jgi:uncharacterized protein YcbK (DUF882 family)
VEHNRVTDVGHRIQLTKRFARALASMAIAGTLALGAWSFVDASPTEAGGETRTISLYQIHTKESLSVTYMQNGRYVPSAMKKLNYFLRDWRRNEPTTIDPKTIDLVWELHADLGSKKPIHVVSGYRSARTNAFLKKVGRKVATKSQHIKGKAIDFFFPDVPTAKIRNSALVRRVGGVGYYRSSGGPTGFLHVDSGNVRHWGPGMGASQMAGLLKDGKKYVGKRLTSKAPQPVSMEVASEDDDNEKTGGIIGYFTDKKGKKQPIDVNAPLAAYEGDGNGLDQLYNDASAVGADTISTAVPLDEAIVDDAVAEAPVARVKRPKLVDPDTDGMAALSQTATVEALADGSAQVAEKNAASAVVKPRLKPKAVMQMAASFADLGDGVSVQPANAPPESQTFKKKPTPVVDALGTVAEAETMLEDDSIEVVSNMETKTSFAAELRGDTKQDVLTNDVTYASVDGGDISWWKRLFSSAEELQRSDSTVAAVDTNIQDVMPKPAILGPDGSGVVGYGQVQSAAGKGNLLSVNREGKGSLPPMNLRFSQANTTE